MLLFNFFILGCLPMSMQKKLKKYSRFASLASGRRLIRNHPPHIMWTPGAKKTFFLFLLFGSISEISPNKGGGHQQSPPRFALPLLPPPPPRCWASSKKKNGKRRIGPWTLKSYSFFLRLRD